MTRACGLGVPAYRLIPRPFGLAKRLFRPYNDRGQARAKTSRKDAWSVQADRQ